MLVPAPHRSVKIRQPRAVAVLCLRPVRGLLPEDTCANPGCPRRAAGMRKALLGRSDALCRDCFIDWYEGNTFVRPSTYAPVSLCS